MQNININDIRDALCTIKTEIDSVKAENYTTQYEAVISLASDVERLFCHMATPFRSSCAIGIRHKDNDGSSFWHWGKSPHLIVENKTFFTVAKTSDYYGATFLIPRTYADRLNNKIGNIQLHASTDPSVMYRGWVVGVAKLQSTGAFSKLKFVKTFDLYEPESIMEL